MTRKLQSLSAIIIAISFCCGINSCKNEASNKAPDFDPGKNWIESFVGQRKEVIYEYIQKENVEASTWEYEGKDELLLTSKFQEMEISFYFLGDVVLLASFDYSTN